MAPLAKEMIQGESTQLIEAVEVEAVGACLEWLEDGPTEQVCPRF